VSRSGIARQVSERTQGVEKFQQSMRLLDVRLLLDKELERLAWDSVLAIRADRGLAKVLKDVYGLEVESFSYSAGSNALKVLLRDRDYRR